MTDHDTQYEAAVGGNSLLSDQDAAPPRETAKYDPEEPGWQTLFEIPREADADDSDQLLNRISSNPKIFGGKPIIRGMRFAVRHVLGMLAAGESVESILDQYRMLEPEDIQACLVFAFNKVTEADQVRLSPSTL